MFTLPELPYSYTALEPYIDEETMHLHHDKHHAAYVKNLNDALAGHEDLLSLSVEEIVKNLSKVPEVVRMKVRNNGGGHVNHTFFWRIMGPPAKATGGKPSGELAKAIDIAFGGFAQFQEKFTAAAMGRFGSGWAWLVSDPKGLSIMDTPNQDTPLMNLPAQAGGKTPILGLDVWEHAYYLKYKNMRADYVKAWWNVINWKEVEKQYAAVSR